ncbi:MAG: LysE family transporter [Bacteriovoracaceae bacterium]|nr:LysE family transporter [Bacteriovoracaceae bacterium]
MGSLFFEGLILQASLIFALGAQNIFVLEAGLRRQHHIMICFVCFLCDLTLILMGVAGAATLFAHFPGVKIFIGIMGVFFLFLYGINKIFSNGVSIPKIGSSPIESTLKKSVLLAITFSVLNPHAYLDAFVLIGGFSTKYELLQERLMLGLGAGVYSGIWFLVLSSLSSFMKPILEHPLRMKMIMSVAGCALVFLSGKLGVDVAGWIQVEFNASYDQIFMTYPVPPGRLFTTILY